jgi:GGDEF domain-containing protein
LLELDGLARGQDPDALLSRLERLLEDQLTASGGRLTRERPGRCWLLVPDTDKLAAQRLAERLLAAVAAGAQRLGTPLSIAVGIAVCPEDGERAPALAAHADVGLYAARADARAASVRAPRDGGGSTG